MKHKCLLRLGILSHFLLTPRKAPFSLSLCLYRTSTQALFPPFHGESLCPAGGQESMTRKRSVAERTLQAWWKERGSGDRRHPRLSFSKWPWSSHWAHAFIPSVNIWVLTVYQVSTVYEKHNESHVSNLRFSRSDFERVKRNKWD